MNIERAVIAVALLSTLASCRSPTDEIRGLRSDLQAAHEQITVLNEQVRALNLAIGTPLEEDFTEREKGLTATLQRSTSAVRENAAKVAGVSASLDAMKASIDGVAESMDGFGVLALIASALAAVGIVWAAVGTSNASRTHAEAMWVDGRAELLLPAGEQRLLRMSAYSVRDLSLSYRYSFFFLLVACAVLTFVVPGWDKYKIWSYGLLMLGIVVVICLYLQDRAGVIHCLDRWPLRKQRPGNWVVGWLLPFFTRLRVIDKW